MQYRIIHGVVGAMRPRNLGQFHERPTISGRVACDENAQAAGKAARYHRTLGFPQLPLRCHAPIEPRPPLPRPNLVRNTDWRGDLSEDWSMILNIAIYAAWPDMRSVNVEPGTQNLGLQPIRNVIVT